MLKKASVPRNYLKAADNILDHFQKNFVESTILVENLLSSSQKVGCSGEFFFGFQVRVPRSENSVLGSLMTSIRSTIVPGSELGLNGTEMTVRYPKESRLTQLSKDLLIYRAKHWNSIELDTNAFISHYTAAVPYQKK